MNLGRTLLSLGECLWEGGCLQARLSSPARPHRPLPGLASLPARLDPGQLGLLCVSGNGLPFWKVHRDPPTVSSAHTDPDSCTKALVDQQLVCVLNTQVLREVGPTCHHCSRMSGLQTE